MENEEIRGELADILTKLKNGDTDLERLKLRLYGTRQAIQLRAIECADRRLTHEAEVLSHLREGVRPPSQTPVLPEASRPVYLPKNLRDVWNTVSEEASKRQRNKTKILLKPLSDKRIKNAR